MINSLSLVLFPILWLLRSASFFSVAEPHSAARPLLCIYPRVNELVADTSERVSKLACESEPLSRVIPLRRKVFSVADQPDYSLPRFLNPDCRDF